MLGKWNSVYQQFRRWSLAGLWDLLLNALADSGAALKTIPMIDSTMIRAHHQAAGEMYDPPHWQVVSGVQSEQSASTYPVSRSIPGHDGEPRVPSLIKGPMLSAILRHRLSGLNTQIFPCLSKP